MDRLITQAEIEKILGEYHSNLGKFGDDVVFVGESDKYWWVLHLDCDVSDCCIGRTPKAEVYNHFHLDGDTDTKMSNSEFVTALCESVLYWKDKTHIG